MIRVGILGATGYTALELIQLLLRHPDVHIILLTSRQEDSPHVSQVHRQLAGRLDLRLQQVDIDSIIEQTDVVFSCLPHAASAEVVKPLVDGGKRVIDFSADYRLDDRDTYESWYRVKHPDPERIGKVAYGLPELFADAIAGANLVANPGCFPTSAILALAPLLKEQLIEPQGLIIDSKTGVTGAGRNPKLRFHFPECNESIAAYSVGQHRHTPEIDQVLSKATGAEVDVLFAPHLVPMDRGILSTCYGSPAADVTSNQLMEALRSFYDDMPFVRVTEELPETSHVRGTNFCDLTARVTRGRVVVVSAIDNLGKGASSAAVQNFNCMLGFDETTALL